MKLGRLIRTVGVQALVAGAMAVGVAATASAQDRTVNIYNWSDYIAEDTLAKFEAATGIKPVYDVYDSNEVLEAKLLAGNSGYDVVFPTARPYALRQIQAGVHGKLDKSKLPNLKNMDAGIMASMVDMDPDNGHGIPYMWGTTGLGYNAAKVKELLGADAPTDSWALVFDPKYAEKLAGCGISFLDEGSEGIVAGLAYLGRDPAKATAQDMTDVENLFKAIRPFVKYFHSSQYINDLANGDLCVAHGYSGDLLQARSRAQEAKNGVEVVYMIPKEGAVLWNDLMLIPADAPHKDEAHAFINFLMEPEIIAAISNFVAYANANAAATPFVDEAVRNDPGIYPPEAVKAKLFPLPTFDKDTQRAMTRSWTRIKTGQ